MRLSHLGEDLVGLGQRLQACEVRGETKAAVREVEEEA